MFEKTVTSIPDAERQLLGSLSQFELSVLRSQLTLAAASASTPTPSCQLAYHEVSGEFVDQLFSYAGIAQHNGPVGLAGSFAPISRPPELVVFPISGLLSHLGQTSRLT